MLRPLYIPIFSKIEEVRVKILLFFCALAWNDPNTGMPVNTNVPAFSRPAPQHHPNTQPTPSNVTSTRPSPNLSTSNPSYLNATPSPPPGFKSSPTLPNSTTHQSTTNYLLPPTGQLFHSN